MGMVSGPGSRMMAKWMEATYIPAIFCKLLGLISAVEELAFKELDSHHSKDEHEEHIHNENIEDIFE